MKRDSYDNCLRGKYNAIISEVRDNKLCAYGSERSYALIFEFVDKEAYERMTIGHRRKKCMD